MFRQVKVDILGLVENMSHFHCPHCQKEIDIFSKGGVERTAKQFDLGYLGALELDPEVRRGGDTGKPVTLAGENSPHAKQFYDFAKRVVTRVNELRSSAPGDVVQIR
jgi:ATP-binding protein involved in chromosome partitioning